MEDRVARLERLLVRVATTTSPTAHAWTELDREVARILEERPELRPAPYVTELERLEAGQGRIDWHAVSVGA